LEVSFKGIRKYPFDGRWELYPLGNDRTGMKDLAEIYPETIEEMKTIWEDWAQRIKIYLLDNCLSEKQVSEPNAITKKYF